MLVVRSVKKWLGSGGGGLLQRGCEATPVQLEEEEVELEQEEEEEEEELEQEEEEEEDNTNNDKRGPS